MVYKLPKLQPASHNDLWGNVEKYFSITRTLQGCAKHVNLKHFQVKTECFRYETVENILHSPMPYCWNSIYLEGICFGLLFFFLVLPRFPWPEEGQDQNFPLKQFKIPALDSGFGEASILQKILSLILIAPKNVLHSTGGFIREVLPSPPTVLFNDSKAWQRLDLFAWRLDFFPLPLKTFRRTLPGYLFFSRSEFHCRKWRSSKSPASGKCWDEKRINI